MKGSERNQSVLANRQKEAAGRLTDEDRESG